MSYSKAEREAIRKRHVKRGGGLDSSHEFVCDGGHMGRAPEWPCVYVRLAEAEERLEGVVLLPQYRLLTAEVYWEDSGLYVWEQERFKDVTELAKQDVDPDNPQRLI